MMANNGGASLILDKTKAKFAFFIILFFADNESINLLLYYNETTKWIK